MCQYAPIAKAFYKLDDTATAVMKCKFDIAYVIAKQNMAFAKMGSLCELEERHGVDLGKGYKNELACAEFIHYIAQEQLQGLVGALSKAKFFSLQADGSTDSGNVEDEVFLAVYFDPYAKDGKVHVRSKFLTVRRPARANAEGLFACLKAGLDYVGVSDWESKLIGFGCDGANVNMGARGLRGFLQLSMPWIVVFWCLAHRLELALKDALKNTYFSQVDELLLRIYYLYEKSPKKCHELDDVVMELKHCLEPSEIPKEGGNRPLRACGTRFIAHKVLALGRLIDRFGAYISHLSSLTEDSTVRAVDKQKITGYIRKWRDAKMLFGCAYFYDILKPMSVLCKALQADEVCVVQALESILKTSKAVEKVKETAFEDLPSVRKVHLRIKQDDSTYTYQGADLFGYTEAIAYFTNHHQKHTDLVQSCLKERMTSQENELLTHTLNILATQGWARDDDAAFGYLALQYLSERFQVPLQHANVDSAALQGEWDEIVDYAKRYLNIATEENSSIWWKLFNSPTSKDWSNILGLVELLFSLPMSNGHLERVFSQLKIIKTNRRTGLGENRLDSLLRIVTTGPPLSQWDASGAVELWWSDKKRRSVEDSRAPPTRSGSSSSSMAAEPPEASATRITLEDWESWAEV